MRCLPDVMRLSLALTAILTLASALTPPPAAAQNTASPCTLHDFGAVADGRTDDTAAIQRAVDSGRGDVRFAPGVYRITKPIVVDLNKVGFTSLAGQGVARIVMDGPGPAIKLLGTHDGTADPPTVKPQVWQHERMPTVDGLEILGAHPEAVGIEAAGTMQLTVTRVIIRRCLHAIHLVRRNRNVIVADCHLYDNRGIGLYLDDVNLHQINVTGCHISYNVGGGIVSRAGNVRNLQVAGCDIESNMSAKAPPTANVLIDSTDGSDGTAEVAITGCTIQHNTSPGSAGIRFLGTDRKDRRWGHLTVANNIFSDVQVGVDIQTARGATVVGNTFGKAVQYDLRIVDSSHVVVSANVLDRNPGYDSQEKSCNGGVLLRNCRDMTISGLHVAGVRRLPAGVVLENCRRVNLSGCTVLDCDNAGILLQGVSDSRISGCLIRNDETSKQPWTPVKMGPGNKNVLLDNLPAGQQSHTLPSGEG